MTRKRLQKTFHAKSTDVTKSWVLVDAENKTLGRIATVIADVLRGKNKPNLRHLLIQVTLWWLLMLKK